MKREVVLKWLKIFSIAFIFLYIIEFIDLLFFGNMQINLEGEQVLLTNLIFSSEFINLTSSISYIFLVSLSLTFLIFSMFLLRISIQGKIENLRLSKIIFMAGLICLTADFIKLFYIYIIDTSIISIPPSTSYTFIEIVFNYSITPLFVEFMWFYIIIVAAIMIFSGLILSGVGLQWFLKLENEAGKKK